MKLNILVVDDDVGTAKALRRLLRALGHTVHIVYSAVEGLELASQLKPDLILHDLLMPKLDGYEAARRIRKIPSLAKTLLVACSGSVNERKARAAGFDAWLIKPIDDNDLNTVIAMASRRLNRRNGTATQ